MPRTRSRRKNFIFILLILGYLLFYLYNSFSPRWLKFGDIDDRALKSVYSYPTDHLHLAIVCVKSKYTQMAITSIKSILFQRRKWYNLTLHIFTDKIGRKLIVDAFSNRTKKSCIKIRFYNIARLIRGAENFLSEHQLQVTHYSGIYAFSKIFIHDYLPLTVSHVITVDTDVLLLDDIYSIWDEFRRFQPDRTIMGLTPWYPPLPPYYHYNGSEPDPFITGIVLLDLNIARAMNFTPLLSQITKYASVRFRLRTLWTADQVIFSLFGMYMPEYIVSLPCYNNAHTYHHLQEEKNWQSTCGETYPRNVHVVPAARLKQKDDYFGHMSLVFEQMPLDWLWFCIAERSDVL